MVGIDMKKSKGHVLIFTLIVCVFISSIALISFSVVYRYYINSQNRINNLREEVFKGTLVEFKK